MNTASPVIIFGAQGSGKTQHAAALAKHFGKGIIFDEATPAICKALPANAIVFTNQKPEMLTFISIGDALLQAGIHSQVNLASTSRRLE